ncbi:uncharacterized protein LOC111044096 [Nilaparvata lugens]|uniref:uncharacterized protein LOC111044096 n=1 Tax=Nilaparvata lugens TaxID=108931 RepID=UPI00193D4BE7|nr:uncharacterized protein LOC111044096 [Nilaparvata lugens]
MNSYEDNSTNLYEYTTPKTLTTVAANWKPWDSHGYDENVNQTDDSYYYFRQHFYQISLPYIRCCDKRFNKTFWSIDYFIMFAFTLLLFIAFGYLGDTVLRFSMAIFGLACLGDTIVRFSSILAPILTSNYWNHSRWNPWDCYIEDVLLILSYIYTVIVMDSYSGMISSSN